MAKTKQTYLPFDGAKPNGKFIYPRWIVDKKTGKRRYPKHARVFKIWVPFDEAA